MIRTQFSYRNTFRFQVTNLRPGALDRTRAALGLQGKISDWCLNYQPDQGWMVIATDLARADARQILESVGLRPDA